MIEITTSTLTEHFIKVNKAITLLFENDHTESALILLYSWVDRMAWLSIKEMNSTGIHFKSWLNNYVIPHSDLPCNADDLWAARCGLLHTGTAGSRDVHNGNAKPIYYYSGLVNIRDKKSKVVYLNTKKLHDALTCAFEKFRSHLDKNKDELQNTNSKLEKILRQDTDFE